MAPWAGTAAASKAAAAAGQLPAAAVEASISDALHAATAAAATATAPGGDVVSGTATTGGTSNGGTCDGYSQPSNRSSLAKASTNARCKPLTFPCWFSMSSTLGSREVRAGTKGRRRGELRSKEKLKACTGSLRIRLQEKVCCGTSRKHRRCRRRR